MPDVPLRHRLRTSWQGNARSWQQTVRAGGIASRRQTDAAILKAVLEQKPRRVLDVGCGEGWLTRALATADPRLRLWGLEGSGDLVHAARAADGRVRTRYRILSYEAVCAGQQPVPLPVDVVVFNFALLCDRTAAVLTAFARYLAPGGVMLVQTLPPVRRTGWRVETFAGFGGPDDSWQTMPWYGLDALGWRRVLRQAGLRCHGQQPVTTPERRLLSLLMRLRHR